MTGLASTTPRTRPAPTSKPVETGANYPLLWAPKGRRAQPRAAFRAGAQPWVKAGNRAGKGAPKGGLKESPPTPASKPAAASRLTPHPPTPGPHLLSGQSNMAGNGGVHNRTWDGVVPPECAPDPRILRLSAALQWEEAREPLQSCGVGPGMAFARAVLPCLDAEARLGLVPCAVGATAIRKWARGERLYEQMIARSAPPLSAARSRPCFGTRARAIPSPTTPRLCIARTWRSSSPILFSSHPQEKCLTRAFSYNEAVLFVVKST
ncbi:hypothetical protein EJB05_40429, partial [Eragrostis curvula]